MVYLSSKKFFNDLFPIVNLEEFSADDISKAILDIYVTMLHDYLADKEKVPAGKIIEVRYEMLQENPIDEVEKIYKEFDFSNFHELKPLLMDFMETQKGHKVDAYTMDKKEFDHVMSRLDFAMKHWRYEQPLPTEVKVLDQNQEHEETPIA